MRRPLILFAFVAVGVFVFTWRLKDKARDIPSLDENIALTDTSAAQAARGEVHPPPARDEVELPVGVKDANAQALVPLEDRVPTKVEDPTFEAQYAGWSPERLEERVNVLEPAHLAEIDRLSDLRFEAGLYRVVDSSEVEGLDDSYDVLAEFDRQGVMTRSRAVARELPLPSPPGDSEVEAALEYHIVSLPPDVFPELYRQRAELDWLRATLAARYAAGEDPK